MTTTIRRVAVIGGVRIPFCRSNSLYMDLTNQAMLAATLNALVDRYDLKGVHIDEVAGGAVVTHSRDWNIAREAVIGTKLAPSSPGLPGASRTPSPSTWNERSSGSSRTCTVFSGPAGSIRSGVTSYFALR